MSDVLARLLDRQTRTPAFPGCAGWALALDGKASFADPGSAQAGFDAATATARFLITTSRKDRHGDVVVPDGCLDSIKDYARNPVVFFGHDSSGLPIGSCQKDDGSADLEFTPAGIVGGVRFHLKTLMSEQVCALTEAGELRGSSIGFKPVEAVLHEGKMERLDDESKVIKFEPFLSFTFTKWDLLEWSVVAVPANADALRCRLDKGISGKALCDDLKLLLAPYVTPGKVWVPGAALTTPDPETPSPSGPTQKAADGSGAGKEAAAKRPARKPGELFFLKTLHEIDRHHEHYAKSADEHDHPAVLEYCRDAMSHTQKHRKKTLAKAEELYPEVDFSMAPGHSCDAEDVQTTDVTDDEMTLVLKSLKALGEAQAKVADQFKRATGRV